MGKTLLDLICINIFIVLVLDIHHIERPLKRLYWRWVMDGVPYRDFSAKPFDCSLCLSWWVGLAYVLIAVRPLTIGVILLPLALASFNFIIKDIIIKLCDLWAHIIDKL